MGIDRRFAMPVQLLCISFKFNIPPSEYRQMIKPWVNDILNAPGLRWKIWLVNEVECIAGCIYLFDDAPSVQLFLASPLVDGLRRHPAFANFHVMSFDVLEAETAATYGPIGKGVRV
jgi:hypothetical protein